MTLIKQRRYVHASLCALAMLAMFSCRQKNGKFDAQGTFEAEEILVSPEMSGRILELKVEEGDSVSAGQIVGRVDDTNLALQKDQVTESIRALKEKTVDVTPQVTLLNDQLAVQQTQLRNLQKEAEQ